MERIVALNDRKDTMYPSYEIPLPPNFHLDEVVTINDESFFDDLSFIDGEETFLEMDKVDPFSIDDDLSSIDGEESFFDDLDVSFDDIPGLSSIAVDALTGSLKVTNNQGEYTIFN